MVRGDLIRGRDGKTASGWACPSLLDDLPGRVGIELIHRRAESGGVRPEVLLVDDAVLAANESLDAAVAVRGRPGDHRVACDHVAVDEIGKGAARRRRPLRGEDAVVIALVRLRLLT